MDYHVKLDDIQLSLCIGIADHEYNNPQNVIVAVDLVGAVDENYQFSDIHDCIDYAPMYDEIHSLALGENHIDLLEHLAVKIIDICFENSHVKKCRVTLSKPDLYQGNGVPSVTLSQSRFQ